MTPSKRLTRAAERLRSAALALVQGPDRRVRVEDYVTVLAAAAGEAALAASGFDVDGHDLVPGSGVFGDAINAVLTGDGVSQRTATTTWMVLQAMRTELTRALPDPASLYNHVARSVGKAEWGAVTTTVPREHVPTVLPLRAAFELRPHVLDAQDDAWIRWNERHVLVTTSLTLALEQTSSVLEPGMAVPLACEVLFGMAKMAPMTEAALRSQGN